MKPKHSTFLAALTLITVTASASAASDSWQTNNDGLWIDPANWVGGTPPGSSATLDSTDIATFDFALTAPRFVAVDANRNVGGITFANTSTFGYTLLGGSLRLSNDGVIEMTGNNGAHTDAVTTPVEIQGNGGSATFDNSSTLATRLLRIGDVSGASTGTNVTKLALKGANTGTNALTGIISNGSGGGSLAITKSDGGSWSLQNTDNSFSGGTTLNAGILQALTAGSLGSGQVNLAGGALHLINNANTAYTNDVLVTGNATIASTKASGQSGNISHRLGTLSIGESTLTLAKFFNTTAGTLTFGATTLTGNASFAINAATNLILGPTSGDFSITKGTTGATGILVLAADNSYSGGTNVNVGTLQVGVNTATGTLGSGSVNLDATTTLLFAKNNASTFDNSITGPGGVRLNTAAGVITLTNASHTGSTQIQNGLLQSNNTASNFILGTANATFNYGNLGLLADFNGALGTDPGSVSWATGLNVSGGFAVMDAATRSVNVGGNVVPDTLTVGSAGFAGGTFGGNNSRLSFGDVNGTALGTVDFRNPIDLGTGDRSLVMVVNGQAAFAADLTGAITGSGIASGTENALVKFGNGNIRLSGTNTYAGRTVAGGQSAVIIGSAEAFSPNAWMHLDGANAGTLGGILGLGYNLTANLGTTGGHVHFATSGGFAAFGANRSVTLNSGATLVWASTASFVANSQNLIFGQAKADGTLTLTNPIDLNLEERNVHVNNGPAAIDGALSGTLTNGGLRKAGPGTLALTGTSSYFGDTRVAAGTLLVNGALGDTFTTVETAGTLGGNGSISGSVFAGGSLAPGESIGSLRLGYLVLGETSTYAYELDSSSATGDLTHSTSDLAIVEGAALSVSDLSTAALAPGNKLTLISYSGAWNEVTFTYQGNVLPNGGTISVGGNNWQIKYDDTTGGSNFAAEQSGASTFVTLTTVEGSAYDFWAQSFGIAPQGPDGGPDDDFDGDGTSNLAEFRLGLAPNNGSSRFETSSTRDANDGGITLTWPSQPGLTFSVTSSTTLTGFETPEATVPAAAPPATTTTWTSGPQSDPKKFFRVGFTPAP